jgi:molybdopterin-guanine dinucleotide biosynthesis protein A
MQEHKKSGQENEATLAMTAPRGPHPGLSAAILAGGRSVRMGTDKAFLLYKGRPFVSVIADELLKVSSDVFVVVGDKDRSSFSKIVDPRAKVIADSYALANPMGGMLSTFRLVSNEYAAFVACDTPLMKSEVVEFLHQAAKGHSAAIPRWDNGDIEPLCAVYNVHEAEAAGLKALSEGRVGGRYLISGLQDAVFVPVESLRRFDRDLAFLKNINYREDLMDL